MQNRYAGDVGDFGKFGMLRYIENTGITIGVNWYLVADESSNNDGKHIGYLSDKKFVGCDEELRSKLERVALAERRAVGELEDAMLMTTNTYFDEEVPVSCKGQEMSRSLWHSRSMEAMEGCDLVFMDPDNGLLPKSVGRGSKKSVKYVLEEEILDCYKAGHSVVFYSHRTREKEELYLKRFDRLFGAEEVSDAVLMAISFKRGTIRDYIFICQKDHASQIKSSIEKLVSGRWGQHFEILQINNHD